MQNAKLRIAVLVSGGGTNLGALIDVRDKNELGRGDLALVISSNENAYALERAAKAGIERVVVPRKDYLSAESFSDTILDILVEKDIDFVVLAGFNCILPGKLMSAYENRMINVHAALIPSFCGEGYYGLRVHEAALNAGVKISGATVHFVNEKVDGGPIIMQKAVDVHEDDTPESLQKRIMVEAEQVILPQAVRLFCDGRLNIENNIVKISGGTDE